MIFLLPKLMPDSCRRRTTAISKATVYGEHKNDREKEGGEMREEWGNTAIRRSN